MKKAMQYEARAGAGMGWRNTRLPPHTKSAVRRYDLIHGTVVLATLLLCNGVAKAAQAPFPQQYGIKSSEVVLPQGVAPGQYRRMIQPFPNWTLICDENLKEKQRVCNITQTIIDQAGTMAFSWSLAATSNGKPIMIIRVPAEVGKGSPVQIAFASGKIQVNLVNARTGDCDRNICLILQPVGPVLRDQINKQVDVRITYANPAKGNDPVIIDTTLRGLPKALAAIK